MSTITSMNSSYTIDEQAKEPDDLVFASAHELARAIRDREASAVDVLEGISGRLPGTTRR